MFAEPAASLLPHHNENNSIDSLSNMTRFSRLTCIAVAFLVDRQVDACRGGRESRDALKPYDKNLIDNYTMPTDDDSLSKRWFRVPKYQARWPGWEPGRWLVQSWPEDPDCGGYPIRFCFTDEHSATHGYGALQEGAALYGHASQFSGIAFGLDEGTGSDPMVFCSDPRVRVDTLQFTDHTIPIKKWPEDRDRMLRQPGCSTQASLGYNDPRFIPRKGPAYIRLVRVGFGAAER